MKIINCNNVNDGFIKGKDLLGTIPASEYLDSRAGQVVDALEPVATVFNKPLERVLFEEVRKANPFFHLIESLWMLFGAKDLDYIEYYNKRMREYSDDGTTLQGAYGYRWREHFGVDQLHLIIERLKKDPNDRRSVLQMWDPKTDLDKQSKDVPCNTVIYFKVRNGCLDMTVSNRSNDIIWGTFGANIVHMSILQEYMAYSIGVPLGKYTQISDSFHAYTEIYEDMYRSLYVQDAFDFYNMKEYSNPYENKAINTYPLINTTREAWDKDLSKFLNRSPMSDPSKFTDPFFIEVACPMQDAWYLYKQGEYEESLIEIQGCCASDWGTAGYNWLERSINNKNDK